MSVAPAVALVVPRYSPVTGGIERHAEELARGLLRHGFRVEVITTDPTGQLPPVEVREGVLVRRFATIANDGVYFVSPGLGSWLIANASRFALIHAHSYHTPLAFQAALAARRSGVPLVVTPHYHGSGHTPLRQLLHVPYRLVGGWMLHQAQQLICVSSAERELLQRHFGTALPCTMIPNGVNVAPLLAAQPWPVPNGRRTILAVGRLEHYKQVGRLVQALPLLPQSYHLVVIGDGPDQLHIGQRAEHYGVADRLHLLGRVAQEALVRWYRTADLFVTLSRWEAFGMTMLEAAAAGAPILASAIPAHQEVANYIAPQQVSFVPIDGTPQMLAEAIARAAHRSDTIATTLRTLPTWPIVVERTAQCYQRVLGASPEAIPQKATT